MSTANISAAQFPRPLYRRSNGRIYVSGSLASLYLVPKPREMSWSHNPESTEVQASALTWSNSLSCLGIPLLYPAKNNHLRAIPQNIGTWVVEQRKKRRSYISFLPCLQRQQQTSVAFCSAVWQLHLKLTLSHTAKERNTNLLSGHKLLSLIWLGLHVSPRLARSDQSLLGGGKKKENYLGQALPEGRDTPLRLVQAGS